MGDFWISKKEFKRMKSETYADVRARRKDGKQYNFGISKKELERIRKQAKA